MTDVAYLFPRGPTQGPAGQPKGLGEPAQVWFTRPELDRMLGLYGRMVAAGEWRDYSLDDLKDRAVFSVFRRARETPIYRIEKIPRQARRQGAYQVVSATGLILKRGHSLDAVVQVLERKLFKAVD